MTYKTLRNLVFAAAAYAGLAGNAWAKVENLDKDAFKITPAGGKVTENFKDEVQRFCGWTPEQIIITSGEDEPAIEQVAKWNGTDYILPTQETATSYIRNMQNLRGKPFYVATPKFSLKLDDIIHVFKPEHVLEALPAQLKVDETKTISKVDALNRTEYIVFNVFARKDKQFETSVVLFAKNNKVVAPYDLGDLQAAREFLKKVHGYGGPMRTIVGSDQKDLFKTLTDKYSVNGADKVVVYDSNGDGQISAGDQAAFFAGDKIVSVNHSIDDAIAKLIAESGKGKGSVKTERSAIFYTAPAPGSLFRNYFRTVPMPENVTETAKLDDALKELFKGKEYLVTPQTLPAVNVIVDKDGKIKAITYVENDGKVRRLEADQDVLNYLNQNMKQIKIATPTPTATVTPAPVAKK